MMKKLTANLPIKIISLLAAIVIWVSIMHIINPVVNGHVNVQLEVRNENYVKEQNKDYRILDSKDITINYKVKSDKQTSIKSSDFIAYIDLNSLNSSEGTLAVRYEATNDNADSYTSNIELSPKEVKVILVDNIQKNFKVQHNFTGQLKPGKTVGTINLVPDEVIVSGNSLKVSEIDHLSIDIDLSAVNNDDSFLGAAKANIYSADGSRISNDGITITPEDIGYSMVINSTSNLKINAAVVGVPETGFVHADTIIEPANVVVEGPRSLLQNYFDVNLLPINIDGLSDTHEYKFKLSDYLKAGVKSAVDEVKVTVIIRSNVINQPVDTDIGPHIESDNVIDETKESKEIDSVAETGIKDTDS